MATYKPLQTITVTSATSSITFSGIDQAYTDIVLVSNIRYTSTNVGQGVQLRFNGDSSASYSATVAEGSGSGAVDSYRSTNGTAGIYNAPSKGDQSSFSPVTTFINNYSNVTTYKAWTSKCAGPTYVNMYAGLWRKTAAITSITVVPSGTAGSIDAGCTFSLYGIKAGTSKAIGGDVVTTDGNYWYHAFKNSGTFTVQQDSALTVEYLVVAGGGAGGYDCGGGGGAGGYRYSTNFSCSAGSVNTVLVGAGGAITASRGANGSNSVFATVTSTGGGGGGGRVASGYTGADGGSGGGGGGDNLGAGGAASPAGQGNAGGRGLAGATPGGGGGGAGAAGSNTAAENSPGNGGAGLNTLSSWASATGTGASGYYAGGGGGGYNAGNNGGAGGGGYGAGASSVNSGRAAISGSANTGGGGGGGSNGVAASVIAGAGGSGVVIVRYPV